MDEQEDSAIINYIYDENGLDKNETSLPLNFVYNSVSGSTLQP